MTAHLLITAALAAALAGPPSAAAQAGSVMSVDELTACAREAAALQAENAMLAERRTALAARKTRLAGEMAAAVTPPQGRPADEASDRVRAAALEAVNRDVDALNADSRAVRLRQAGYNAGCAARRYRELDILALPPELQQALQAGRAAGVMSFAELRACAERALTALGWESRAQADAQVTARRAALETERKALEAKGKDVDRLARSELEALRKQRRAFNAKVDALNAEVQARNAAAQSSNAEALAYENACATRPYVEEDAARLPPHLQAALRRQ